MHTNIDLTVKRGRSYLFIITCLGMVSLTACPGWGWWIPREDGEHGPVAGRPADAGSDDADAGPIGPAADSGASEERVCGGFAGNRCEDDEYCNFPESASCGRADATGVCEAKPSACTREYRPVCGCNGRTYGNACTAAADGVDVDHEGECEEETCGGYAGLPCPDGEYCDLAQGQGCEVADASGICEERPEVCTQQYEPVCGCDGETYGNACEAARAGVTVASEGECGG
jgi:hypothetical protein